MSDGLSVVAMLRQYASILLSKRVLGILLAIYSIYWIYKKIMRALRQERDMATYSASVNQVRLTKGLAIMKMVYFRSLHVLIDLFLYLF